MKKENLTINYLNLNLRNHSIEVLEKDGIVGKTINGYYRMISKIIDPLSQEKSDFIVLKFKCYPLYDEVLSLYKGGKYSVTSESKKKRWLHFNVEIPGVTISLDTKKYFEYSPSNRIIDKINIFLFDYEIKDYQRIVNTTLESLAYLDGTGNKPVSRYY